MTENTAELDRLQAAYKQAVNARIAAIREEEALASVVHDVAEIDKWEEAFFHQDELREEVAEAKAAYEDALRKAYFDF